MSEEPVAYDITNEDAALINALVMLQADVARRAQACAQRIQAACAEFRCEVQAYVMVGGKPVPVPVQVVAQA